MMNFLAYYEAFERFVKEMAEMKKDRAINPNPPASVAALCNILRIARLRVLQYANPVAEREENGAVLCYFDSGAAFTDAPLTLRIVHENRSLNVSYVYPPAAEAPWDDDEKERIMLLLKTLHSFNSIPHLLHLARQFAFYDDAKYPNLRYFFRFVWEMSEKGIIDKMNAYHFNLKHFSLINQQLGREKGNAVMRRFFEGLQAIIGDTGRLCRIGGDNFIMLAMKEHTNAILRYLGGTGIVYDETRGEKVLVAACTGVFEIPEHFRFHNESDLMDRIVSCTQAARNSTTTDVVFFTQQMIVNKRHSMQIQQVFPQALAQEEFLVYYQPKVDINSRELIGAEALCRWQHDGRLIPPIEFIPILESGMEICTLDFYMLDKVCRDIMRWLREGKRVVRISVNLSRRHMVDMNLLDNILEIVDRNEVPHEYIEIELTETTTDVEFTDLKRVVGGLQQAGISTSVDDFGVGYSSLNLIEEIPWNVLKVDKSFLPVQDEPSNSRRIVMFKHVISMAQEMGLECITEGVETAEQLQLLEECHCDIAQGYYFDKPLPVKEFEKRLEHHRY